MRVMLWVWVEQWHTDKLVVIETYDKEALKRRWTCQHSCLSAPPISQVEQHWLASTSVSLRHLQLTNTGDSVTGPLE